jgi:hypothetical protein
VTEEAAPAVCPLFDGELRVHYGQVYVWSGPDYPLLEQAFAGQTNGLCGAAWPGALFMITGLHTGRVRFTVESHDEQPHDDDGWEDVVEVSFTPASSRIVLAQWAGEASWPLDLAEIGFRARYCGNGMDDGRAADTILYGEPSRDRYMLQFWPAPVAPDRVLKVTSDVAAYWHRYARSLPAPRPPTPEEQTERQRRASLERNLRFRGRGDGGTG